MPAPSPSEARLIPPDTSAAPASTAIRRVMLIHSLVVGVIVIGDKESASDRLGNSRERQKLRRLCSFIAVPDDAERHSQNWPFSQSFHPS